MRRMASKSFLAAACTWTKTLLRLQVWNLYAKGVQIMRAADCKKLAESPEGDFRQAPRQFPRSGKLPFAMLLLWMIPGNAVFSDSDVCLHCQNQGQGNQKKKFDAVAHAIRSTSLSRTATLMRYQFKI